MMLESCIENLKTQFDVISIVSIDKLILQPMHEWWIGLEKLLRPCYRSQYQNNQRVIILHTETRPQMLVMLQKVINKIDISNFFCVVLVNDLIDLNQTHYLLSKESTDPVSLALVPIQSPKKYQYNTAEPIKIELKDLSARKKFLLTESKTFCIYPWIHLHAYPTGEAWPCCQADMKAGAIGDCKSQSLKEIWNDSPMKSLRLNMLSEQSDPLCVRCYEQESSGFFSGRRSANKHHGHHIDKINHTHADGSLDSFIMHYWDIRFSNLCNLSCRSCGHIFSSNWYADQVKLAGEDWGRKNKPLNIAGRNSNDMWEQLLPHIDYVEQIYFAGGEPLMMEEHYRILEELERRERFDVRLIYNTNFTQVKLKDRYVFDYWKKFHSVAVGASLDAMGVRAEYIRKGTDWATVEANRRRMLDICPEVDFYISPTVSIMNAWHVTDFHREWVERGLLRPQDLNVNILQDPVHYRIDIAPVRYKQRLRMKWAQHLEWLRPLDLLQRATVGLESAITFMMATDNSHLLGAFRERTAQLDSIRNEQILDALPELEILYDENSPF